MFIHRMIRSIIVATLISVAPVILTACSQTPGDAAFRAGHYQTAADLYKKGAEEGNGIAALKLGLMVGGYVSPERYGHAGEWFMRACSRGVLEGCHNLGVAYQEGSSGVKRNIKEAYVFYLRAAERGYMQSQYNLASLYATEPIEPEGEVEGLKWLLVAQRSASNCRSRPICKWILDDPPQHQKKLRARMTPDQIERAQSLADNWRNKED
jgi:hypothetical protein